MNNFQKNFWAGVALIALGLILVFGKSQNQTLNASFENEPVDVAELKNNELSGEIPNRIIIPELKVDIEVKKSRVVGGYWEVFENVAGWGEGSGHPGRNGNQVIFAHARDRLFLSLRDIKKDHRIYVLANDNEKEKFYAYSVVEIKEVYPNQTEVIDPTDDETLTLYTCSGYEDEKRLIVVAKRISLN